VLMLLAILAVLCLQTMADAVLASVSILLGSERWSGGGLNRRLQC